MNQTIKKIAAIIAIFFVLILSVVIYKRCSTWPQKAPQTIETPTHGIKHLGIIMDGNRRWAREQGKSTWFGHQSGAQNAKMAVQFCVEEKIPYLSLYTFSTENFKRSKEELAHIFDIVINGLSDKELQKLIGHGVKIKFVGDRSLFPELVRQAAERIETATRDGNKLTVNLLFAYGGRLEITSAIKALYKDVRNGKLSIDDITEQRVGDYLWTAGCPDPDLIIRTGKRNRLSNFLTWQNVYSELLFSDKYWPAVTKKDLKLAVTDFAQRTRTYGK